MHVRARCHRLDGRRSGRPEPRAVVVDRPVWLDRRQPCDRQTPGRPGSASRARTLACGSRRVRGRRASAARLGQPQQRALARSGVRRRDRRRDPWRRRPAAHRSVARPNLSRRARHLACHGPRPIGSSRWHTCTATLSAPILLSRRASACARRSSSAASASPWTTAPSTICRTRAGVYPSRTTRWRASGRWPTTCSGTPAWHRPGSRRTRPPAVTCTSWIASCRARRHVQALPGPAPGRTSRGSSMLPNRAITRLNVEAPTERQHRRLVSLEDALARFDRAAGARR